MPERMAAHDAALDWADLAARAAHFVVSLAAVALFCFAAIALAWRIAP
jgi:hypothetical protein